MSRATSFRVVIIREGRSGPRVMRGPIANELRRRDFIREKNKTVFRKHTLGVGGIYLFASKSECRIVIRDLAIDQQIENVDELREILDFAEDQEERLARVWREAIGGM